MSECNNLFGTEFGTWVEYPRAHYFKCSECWEVIPYRFGYFESKRFYNFCPFCGNPKGRPKQNNV